MKPAPAAPVVHSEIRRSPTPWLFQGLIIGALLALVAPAISLALGLSPVWLPGASAAWSASHLSAQTADSGVISGMLATQSAFILALPLIWRWLGPHIPLPYWLNDRIVDARALGAFQARDLQPEGMDVLVYVDLPMKRTRIVAGVDASRQIGAARLERAKELAGRTIGSADPDADVQQVIAQLNRTR